MRRIVPRALILTALAITLISAATSAAEADKIKHSIAVFSGLDKITGRIISFEVGMNETVQFGSLLITDRVCYTRPPTEAPQTDTFVQVDQIDADKTTKRIFSGWMFAASPGLNALDQPVYDIWLTDCKGTEQLIPSPSTTQSTPEPEEPEAGAPAGAPNPAPAPPPAPDKLAKTPHAHHHDAAPAGNNGPVEVGPPPGFQPPPDNGDGGDGGGDQPPPPANPDSDR
ncbi:MAG: DUF2155 domain-containing protein [Methylovirgula sp.]|nr:DUF2155 domain-containing protein [Methylovirgula sp.]